ncbi:hypothetical protein M5K25_019252 [Dendrobium thyrsiflorum]|uniref:BZIP domain-containing protein n=1 Tax=Dendrobium thyrsiflorum TaxID=117978 RepID=A0ABD0UL89_DENTH
MDYSPTSPDDQHRIRRMILNRESARRSHMLKQRHIKDLRQQIDRHQLENRALADRFSAISRCCASLFRENERLAKEPAVLVRRLSELRCTLFLRQLQHLFSPPFTIGDGIVGANEHLLCLPHLGLLHSTSLHGSDSSDSLVASGKASVRCYFSPKYVFPLLSNVMYASPCGSQEPQDDRTTSCQNLEPQEICYVILRYCKKSMPMMTNQRLVSQNIRSGRLRAFALPGLRAFAAYKIPSLDV